MNIDTDKIVSRFLKYVSFDTQSDASSGSCPSTTGQLELLSYLRNELIELGLQDVAMDNYGYVTATLPASPGCEDKPVIGFFAHVDTSPDMSGKNIKPQLIRYEGGDLKVCDGFCISRNEFPELSFYEGHLLITTDGTTLLGSDDKSGIAEIVSAMEYLLNEPSLEHGTIRVAFTPDEEIGRGMDHFDVKGFGADYAYTIDGGREGEVEYENFNAAGVTITIHGRNIHPGSAKDKMINALTVANELDNSLPADERPEHTEGYQGFYHLNNMCGDVEHCRMEYIIRDHDRTKFEYRKKIMVAETEKLNRKYGSGTILTEVKDQYFNMREIIDRHPQLIARTLAAVERTGIKPIVKPIRGGTDGARLSYEGLPCPNIFTGGENFHGRYEFCSVDSMAKTVRTIINLAMEWAK